MSVFTDVARYYRLSFDLRRFVRHTMTLEQGRALIRERMRNRAANFLRVLERGVFANPRSPYLRLLRGTGCELGDLQKLATRDGIENALEQLRRAGVYLLYDEFKGKRAIRRAGCDFLAREKDFDNPLLTSWFEGRSGGSGSAGTPTKFVFDYQSERAAYHALAVEAYGLQECPFALWYPILPALAGMNNALRFHRVGKPVAKWFSHTPDRGRRAPLRYRLFTHGLLGLARWWGAELPRPEHVPPPEASRIVDWIVAQKQTGAARCAVSTYVSSAVRICQAAREQKRDIAGTIFLVGSEPLTPARRRAIEAAGGVAIPKFSVTEMGNIGLGCARPSQSEADDMHFLEDSLAVLQHRRHVNPSGVQVDAFLFTSLLPAAPKILLNVESDDFGRLETRRCGCLFDELGFARHLSNVRSFGKLTGEGMSLVGTDLLRLLEEVLPQKFGGAALDYQLVEEYDDNGLARLCLRVDPRVKTVEEGAVRAAVLEHFRAMDDGVAAAIYASAGTLRVERQPPLPTRSGKLLPFAIARPE